MNNIANTDRGAVKGIQKTGHQAFLGIPYAKPPVGRLRFCAPVPCDVWNGVRDAGNFGPSSLQGKSLPGMNPEGPLDEDCLYLNVYTPAADNGQRTVMFWIHGGGFMHGSGSQALYEGEALVRRGDIVLVTINYRLGVLGYLDLSDIGGKSRGAVANAGQLDQIAALEWVRSNIAGFGGNPDNVMIFGESAGSVAVAALLAMPGTEGLFTKAICQSGTANFLQNKSRAGGLAHTFLKELDLTQDTLDTLWDLPGEKLVEAQSRALATEQKTGEGGRCSPVLDPGSLPVRPLDVVREGNISHIPLIVGNNRDENKLFTRMIKPNPDPIDDVELAKRVAAQIPERSRERVGKLIDTYRASRKKLGLLHDNNDIAEAINGDAMFRYPGLKLAGAQFKHQPNTFSYLFTQESPALRGALGACHALELPFVFGTHNQPGQDRFAGSGPEVERLSENMMDAWIAFAKTGNPNHEGIGNWEPYNTDTRPTMIFGQNTELVNAPFEDERAVWEELLGS